MENNNVISTNFIIDDSINMITSMPTKITKRYRRLVLVCQLTGTNLSELMVNKKIMPEISVSNPDTSDIERIIKRNSRPPCKQTLMIGPSKINNDKAIEQYIDSVLTARLNGMEDLTLYFYAVQVVNQIKTAFRTDTILKRLMDNNQLLVIYVGGIAARLCLLREYSSEHWGNIKEIFNTGGDNDVSIKIDPTLRPNVHKIVRSKCVNLICKVLESHQNAINTRLTEHASKITTICLSNKQYTVAPTLKGNTTIYKKNDTTFVDFGEPKYPTYISVNTALDFLDSLNRPCNFDLVRVKYAFKINNIGIFSSEFLDISIPTPIDYKLISEFDEFKNGKYATNIVFPTQSCPF